MARRKAPRIPDALLEQLLAGADPKTAFGTDGLLDELKTRGVEDVLLAVVDGLKGFPEAITAAFPEATVQTPDRVGGRLCIVHLLRHSLDFVSWKDRKTVAAALKGIYRAVDAAAGEAALAAFEDGLWGRRYPAIGQSWRRAWSEVVPFYAFPTAAMPASKCRAPNPSFRDQNVLPFSVIARLDRAIQGPPRAALAAPGSSGQEPMGSG